MLEVAVDAWSERLDVMTVELGRVAANFSESGPEVTSAQAGLQLLTAMGTESERTHIILQYMMPKNICIRLNRINAYANAYAHPPRGPICDCVFDRMCSLQPNFKMCKTYTG